MGTILHSNGHLPCVLDTETTGLNFRKNEIFQIAVIPVNEHFDVEQTLTPFVLDLKPNRVADIDKGALEVAQSELGDIMLRGMDQFKAADLFCEWVERLNLAHNKRLMPIACNWPFDRDFIREWLGFENFNTIFDSRYRDLISVTHFLNDRAWFSQNMPYPYPKQTLQYICNVLNVRRDKHGAMEDAVSTIQCYKKLVALHQI